MMGQPEHRRVVLGLYRQLLRCAKRLPGGGGKREKAVCDVRRGFRENLLSTDPEK